MHGYFLRYFRRHASQRTRPAGGVGCVPGSLPRPDPDPHRVGSSGLPALVYRYGAGSARRGPDGHRAVCALVAGCSLLPALDGVAAVVGRGRFLPGLRDRPDPAALTSRLRPPADRAGRVTHPRPGAPAIRSLDYHRAVVGQHQRLRLGRSLACSGYGSSKPAGRTSPTCARNTATASCGCGARAARSCSFRSRPR
jgi:hypothetical protein